MAPLAVSLGDPAGVGPELIAEAWAQRSSQGLAPFCVVGGGKIIADAAVKRGLDITVEPIANFSDAAGLFDKALPVLALEAETSAYTPGEPSQAGAELAVQSLEAATKLALSSEAAGLVTGPVSKVLLAGAGFDFPGQTEFLAERCGVGHDDAVMMLAGPSLRAVPLTVHCALAEVPWRLSAQLIVRRSAIVAAALQRDFGIENPRLAICALNPHAGENGRMGDEESRIIEPAIAALQKAGIEATGPHPADAIFTPRARETYDAAIAMYHDQALVPLKALDFDSGVNVTLGLPIIRTSADHGTAFDIAGKGVAHAGATIAAIKLAGECAARRAAAGE